MNSLTGLFASRKTLAAIFATVLIAVPLVFGWSGWNAQERQSAVTHAIYAVAGVWGLNVIGIAHEDAAAKSAPSQQVNVGSDVKNAAPAAAPGATAPTPAPVPQPQLVPTAAPAQPPRLVVVPAAQMQQMADAAIARYVAAHPPEPQAAPAQPQQPTP